jgi:hypothetical protein
MRSVGRFLQPTRSKCIVPVPVLAFLHFGSVSVFARSITSTCIKYASASIGIFALLSNTSISTVHYRYCHYLVPVPVLAFWYFCPMPALAQSITGTGIKWCQYQYLHICSYVQYQYWQGTSPVLPLLGARTGIGISILWFIISIGTVHYQYWHLMVPALVLAYLHFGPIPVLA